MTATPRPRAASCARTYGAAASKAIRGRKPACAQARSSAPRRPVPRGRLIRGRSRSAASGTLVRPARAEERVVRCDGGDQGLVEHDLEGEARRGLLVREPDHGDVEFAAAQRVQHPLGGVLGEGDLDLRVGVVEVGQQGGHLERAGGGAGDQADRDPAAQQPGELVHGLPDPVDGGERGPRVRQHRLAHLRQGHRPAGAVQQRLAELPLQLPDLGAHPWLGQMQAGGGPGEAAPPPRPRRSTAAAGVP